MEDTPVRRLPEDTIADILLRLPAKYVLRSGAVCKAWRGITTNPHFLAARARRQQPQSILVHTYLDAAPWRCSSDLLAGFSSEDIAVEAIPVSNPDEDRQRLFRYPGTRLTIPALCGRLLASCNGVLLYKKDKGLYLLCNPITRQWAELPKLPDEYCKDIEPEYAFYYHQPSGEFRLLCCLRHRIWYIVSTGSAEPRHLKMNQDPDLITRFMHCLSVTATMPVLLHGSLHWPPIWRCATGETRIMAFNTVSESFRQMAGPTSRTPRLLKLLEMEGMLAAADFGVEKHVDLWFLEDYSDQGWAHRHRVTSPWKFGNGEGLPRNDWGMRSVVTAGDDEGNVILGNNDALVVYDVKGRKTPRTINSVMNRKNRQFVSKHVFKGSLVQHMGFSESPSADSPLIHSWSYVI